MIISSTAIVLSKLKYRDNDLIVKLLVRELGVTSFIVRGGSKKINQIIFNNFHFLKLNLILTVKEIFITLKILNINSI